MRARPAREDVFLVGIEIAMTESMASATSCCRPRRISNATISIAAYGHHWLQRAEPVIPPLGESLPNTEIFRRLAARFGFDDACFKASDQRTDGRGDRRVDPRMRGTRPSEIPVSEALRMATADGRPLALFDNVMPATPSGKVELPRTRWPSAGVAAARLPAYPAAQDAPAAVADSPASDKRISSTLLGRGWRPGEAPPLLMHPDDAAARGLARRSRCGSATSSATVVLRLQSQRRGAARRGRVGEGRLAGDQPDRTDDQRAGLGRRQADLAEGACYNDTAVEVEAWPA